MIVVLLKFNILYNEINKERWNVMKNAKHIISDRINEKNTFDLDYIYEVRQLQKTSLHKDIIEQKTRDIMFHGIQNDLMRHNYQTLLQKYIRYFDTKPLRKKTIGKGDVFFRGRLGKRIIKGTDHDRDKAFIVPFHSEEIGTAPHLFVKGGRFNREGVAYLYLASDIKTCLAEIHSQVGQECSIAKFTAIKDVVLLNLVETSTDLEMRIWYEILTQPVYEDIKYKYLITQFLADVFSRKFENGIYFNSSQGNGHNIVSFHPEQFALVPYSEKLYSTRSISIKEVLISDSADEFTEPFTALHAYNRAEHTWKKEEISYLEELIQYRYEEKENKKVSNS